MTFSSLLGQDSSAAPAPANAVPELALIDFDIDEFLDGVRGGESVQLVESVLRAPPEPPQPPAGSQPVPPGQTCTEVSPTRARQTRQQQQFLRAVLQRVRAVLPDVPDSDLPAGITRRALTLRLLDYAMSQWRTKLHGNIPLHKFAAKGDVHNVVRTADLMKLFRHHTHVNTQNWLGETPLHVVTCPAAAEALLWRGASLQARDAMGNTPVHTAARYHRVAVLNALLRHVEDVTHLDAKNHEGYTALHLVVMHQPCGDQLRLALSALVEASVDVNVSDDTGGRTPLFHAVLRGDEPTVRYLVENNAAVNQADFSDTTPLQAAEDLLSGEDSHICSILLEKGGFKLPPADRIIQRSAPSRARKRPRPL